MTDTHQRADLFSAANILKLTFFAFVCGLVFVLGQSLALSLAYFSTFSYSDFVSYSVYGLIAAFVTYLVAGFAAVILIFPFAQLKKIRELSKSEKNRLEIAFQFLALLIRFSFLPLAWMVPNFSFDLKSPITLLWILFTINFFLVALLRIWKGYTATGMDNAVEKLFDGFEKFARTASGTIILVLGLFVAGIAHVDLGRDSGAYVTIHYTDESQSIRARIISSNSNCIVLGEDRKIFIVSRDKIKTLEFDRDRRGQTDVHLDSAGDKTTEAPLRPE